MGKRTTQPAMALSIAGLFALLLGNTNPVLTFEVVGRMQSGFIITGVIELIKEGYLPIALLVFFAGILAPALYLGAVCYVSTACSLGLRLPMLRKVFEFVRVIEPWNLIPVYTIATLVAVVKLRMLGEVEWQYGARWVLGVAVLSLFAGQTFHRRVVEERFEALGV
jgi:paraquat-inducible protein A